MTDRYNPLCALRIQVTPYSTTCMAANEKVAFIHTMNNRMGEVKLNLVIDCKLLRFLLIKSKIE